MFSASQTLSGPAHHQCRSTTVPVLKSWEELGIPGLKDAPESTRAALGGAVPGKLTYGDWLKRQPASMQDLALGKGRAALFRAGKLDVRDLVDSTGRSLTLKELRALEGLD
jgi:hypothetical protein